MISFFRRWHFLYIFPVSLWLFYSFPLRYSYTFSPFFGRKSNPIKSLLFRPERTNCWWARIEDDKEDEKSQLIFMDFFFSQTFFSYLFTFTHEKKVSNIFLTKFTEDSSLRRFSVTRIENFFFHEKILKEKNVTFENFLNHILRIFSALKKSTFFRKLKFSGNIIFIVFLSTVGGVVTLMQSRIINLFRLELFRLLSSKHFFHKNIRNFLSVGRRKIDGEIVGFNKKKSKQPDCWCCCCCYNSSCSSCCCCCFRVKKTNTEWSAGTIDTSENTWWYFATLWMNVPNGEKVGEGGGILVHVMK